MSVERKLVLLPVDGSDQSMEAVRYVSKAVNLSNSEVVFFSVIDKTPDIFWDSGEDPTVSKHLEHMRSWDSYKEEKMRECMSQACKLLEQAGVSKASMTCNVQKRNEGIARDIICECKYGYNAVVIGRKGLGQMDDSMLGSIAAKVFINVTEAPVCLLGGKPKSGKIMVGLDNSLSAIRAVNFVSQMFNAADSSVELVHIARIPETGTGKPLDAMNVAKIVEEEGKNMKPLFEQAAATLTAAGFAPEKITAKVAKGTGSRAINLYNEAKAAKCGTLVVGRKGLKDVQEFTMGRIPYKLGQIARNVALWLVP